VNIEKIWETKSRRNFLEGLQRKASIFIMIKNIFVATFSLSNMRSLNKFA